MAASIAYPVPGFKATQDWLVQYGTSLFFRSAVEQVHIARAIANTATDSHCGHHAADGHLSLHRWHG